MSEDRTQTVAPQHPEVAKALENITIHTRVTDQGLAPEGEELEEMVGRVPVLAPFGSNPYAGVVAVLDWDHSLPSEYMILRIYAAYSGHEFRKLETQLRGRRQQIAADNLYPEFDVPDMGELECSESYAALMRIGGEGTFEDFRFSAPWRKEVRAPQARQAISAVKKLDSYKKAFRQRDNDALGSAVVVGWSPPCLAHSDAWAVEVWLLIEFDGAAGRSMVFMVDSESFEISREYVTDVHLA